MLLIYPLSLHFSNKKSRLCLHKSKQLVNDHNVRTTKSRWEKISLDSWFLCMQKLHLWCGVSDSPDLLRGVFLCCRTCCIDRSASHPLPGSLQCPAITKTSPRVMNWWPPAAQYGSERGHDPHKGAGRPGTLQIVVRVIHSSLKFWVFFACVYHALTLIKKHNNVCFVIEIPS